MLSEHGARTLTTPADLPRPSDLDEVRLTTVGIDIGSSTSHATFSRLLLRRLGDHLASRFVTVERVVLYESPIRLTPYRPDRSIDAASLRSSLEAWYAAAGLTASDVDTGAVILTGEAVKRRNARAIGEHLASIAGAFVCATAGPHLEATIAAHGSGAVALSRRRPQDQVLNVDIGGGTTKLSLIEDGTIRQTAAIGIGGRLIALEGGRIVRLETAGEEHALSAGVAARLGDVLAPADAGAIVRTMTALLLDVIGARGTPAPAAGPWVTPPMILRRTPDHFVLSGGVAEYALGRETRDLGDLGRELGHTFRAALEAAGLWSRVAESAEAIRATVVGASQYTIQVSGNTVSLSDPGLVPIRDVRVVSPGVTFPLTSPDAAPIAAPIRDALRRHGLERSTQPFALAFRWRGVPFHGALLALAEAATRELARLGQQHGPLILLFDGDVGRSIGELIRTELVWPRGSLCLDGIEVGDFDFIDIGARLEPSGAFPVVVKSLVYPPPDVT